MTIEQKAEEYVKSVIDVNAFDWKIVREICLAYIEGAKENGIEWHDLRENQNDLPPKMGLGSEEVYIQYSDGVTDFAYYRFDKNKWERSDDEEEVVDVIAWTEIPVYNEGELK